MRSLLVPAALLALAACGPAKVSNEQAAARGQQAHAAAPYYARLPMSELMPHVLQYAADGIWDRQGIVIDEAGEHSLFPKDDAEWEKAESAGLTLAEVTNTLLVPGRRIPEAEWDRSVAAVRDVALDAARAAERHDQAAFFAAGERLDAACDACHIRYDPRFKQQGAPR